MHGLYDGDFAGYKIASPAEADAALREAVVAVDASVLLDLYRFRPQTSRDLIETLRSLGDRLVVPHQALREFWRRRQRAQDSPAAATKVATDALDKSSRSICDALSTWARAVGADDEEVSDVIARVKVFLGGLKDELRNVLPDPSAEGGGDPILEQLEEILAGRVTSSLPPEEWDECVAEANRRIEAEEPPGYMDAEKQDGDLPEGGAGDFLVWYEATRYAKGQDRDLLIVTRDQKQDWWWRQQTDFIGPRPELALEYHQLTGRRLFLMRPADLLARASVLNVQVDQASSADAVRVALIEDEVTDTPVESKTWTNSDDDLLLARSVWQKFSPHAKAVFSLLMDQPGTKVSGEDLATRLGIPNGKSGVAGVLAWPARHCAAVGREGPWWWEYGPEGDGAYYWVEPEVADLFNRVRN
jgi:hypothetical protein